MSIRPTTLTHVLYLSCHSRSILVFSAFAPIIFTSATISVSISSIMPATCRHTELKKCHRAIINFTVLFFQQSSFLELTGQDGGCEGALQQTPQKKMGMSFNKV